MTTCTTQQKMLYYYQDQKVTWEKSVRADYNNIIIANIKKIFKHKKLSKLSDYEKRALIFAHVCKTISYDYDKLAQITNFAVNKVRISRNPQTELESVLFNQTGICNSISQYYKLLLEQAGIPAYCVICDDGTPVKHQLNLVYNKDTNTFSFDDTTSVIVGRGTASDFFDYDVQSAHEKHQGTKKVIQDDEFFILPEDYINWVVGRNTAPFPTLPHLPENLISTHSENVM